MSKPEREEVLPPTNCSAKFGDQELTPAQQSIIDDIPKLGDCKCEEDVANRGTFWCEALWEWKRGNCNSQPNAEALSSERSGD